MTYSDDLGRVVIPKEIRRTMHIREGDPLEIFTDREGGVIFKKYSPLGELSTISADCATSLYSVSGLYCAICDMDNVIAFAGQGKKDTIDRGISAECADIIQSRKNFVASDTNDSVSIIKGGNSNIIAASPIIAEGDVAGLVAFLDTPGKKASTAEQKMLAACAMLLGKQLEN